MSTNVNPVTTEPPRRVTIARTRLTNDAERASGGSAGGGATKVKEVPFTLVTRTKRKGASAAQKGAQANDSDPSLAHHSPVLRFCELRVIQSKMLFANQLKTFMMIDFLIFLS